MITDFFNLFGFSLEAENMPDMLWLTQLFNCLPEEYIFIMNDIIHDIYDEDGKCYSFSEWYENKDKEGEIKYIHSLIFDFSGILNNKGREKVIKKTIKLLKTKNK